MSLSVLVAKQTTIQVVGKIFSTILGIIAFSLITHYLDPERFGMYTTITAFVQAFAIIADCGISLVALQMMAEVNRDWKKDFQAAFSARIVIITGMMILAPVVALAFPYPPELKLGIALMAISFFLSSLIQMLRILFQYKLKMHVPLFADLISYVVLLVGIIVVMKLDLGLYGVIGAVTLNNVIQLGVMFFSSTSWAPIRLTWDKREMRELFSRSWPIALSIFFNLLYLRTDTIILSLFHPQQVVGLYGAAYRVLDVIASLPPLFMGIIIPSFAQSWSANDRDRFARYFQKSFDAIALAAFPLAIGTYFTADRLMVLISGPAYADAGGILKILSVAGFFVFVGSFFGHLINVIHAQRIMLWGYLASGIVAVAGYFIFIPPFGAPAAAWITIISELLVVSIAGIVFWKCARIRLQVSGVLKIALASLCLAAFLFATSDWSLLAAIPGAVILYSSLIVLFGVVPLEFLRRFLFGQSLGK